MGGVGILLKNVVTDLYGSNIKMLHRPLDFFRELEFSIDHVVTRHEQVRQLRANTWAADNNTYSSKYNLFFAQSQSGLVSTQVLDYVIHRWGVPLSVPLLLEKKIRGK